MPDEHADDFDVVGLATMWINNLMTLAHELSGVEISDFIELEVKEGLLVGAYKLALERIASPSTRNDVTMELGSMINQARIALAEKKRIENISSPQADIEPVILAFSSAAESPPDIEIIEDDQSSND